MSKAEKCPSCGATSPVVAGGICGACVAAPRKVGKHPNLGAPYGKESLPHYHPLNNPEVFIADWDGMIGTIADFADKYRLPKPEIIIHPEMHMMMNAVARQKILGTLIYRGVKVRTGIFESATVLRER